MYEIIYFDHNPSEKEQEAVQEKLFKLEYEWMSGGKQIFHPLSLNAYVLHPQKKITYIAGEVYKNFEEFLGEKFGIGANRLKRVLRSDQFLKSRISIMETE